MKTIFYLLLFVVIYLTTIAVVARVMARQPSALKIAVTWILMYAFIGMSLIAFFSAVADAADLRTHIAVIDTGANVPPAYSYYLCQDESHLDLTGRGMQDAFNPRHGTNIAGILAKRMNPRTQCLQIIKWVHDEEDMDRFNHLTIEQANSIMSKALKQALKYKAKYVNLSFGGKSQIPLEREGIILLLRSGAIVASAAGNESTNLDNNCNYYPACYSIKSPNFHIVGNQGSGYTNYGNKVTDWARGIAVEGFGYRLTGTSQATAVFLGGLLK